jgi:tRNA(fMet)-specific endonuclease VapC
MIVLDSDILALIAIGNPRVIERLSAATEIVVTTVITRIEFLRGRFDFLLKASNGNQLQRAQQWLIQSERDLRRFVVLPIDNASADVFDRLRLDKKLRKIGRADLLIACIVLAHRGTLVTRNVRHFRDIPGLQVQNWVD